MQRIDLGAGIATIGSLFGAVTLTDASQALSFAILVLTAIHWALRIKHQIKRGDDL